MMTIRAAIKNLRLPKLSVETLGEDQFDFDVVDDDAAMIDMTSIFNDFPLILTLNQVCRKFGISFSQSKLCIMAACAVIFYRQLSVSHLNVLLTTV